MSGAKHTPGPWRDDSCKPLAHEVMALTRRELSILVSPEPSANWKPVAVVTPSARGRKVDAIEEARANARLIASAPDLLQVCESLDDALQGACLFYPCVGGSGSGHLNGCLVLSLRTVIAKARGGK